VNDIGKTALLSRDTQSIFVEVKKDEHNVYKISEKQELSFQTEPLLDCSEVGIVS